MNIKIMMAKMRYLGKTSDRTKIKIKPTSSQPFSQHQIFSLPKTCFTLSGSFPSRPAQKLHWKIDLYRRIKIPFPRYNYHHRHQFDWSEDLISDKCSTCELYHKLANVVQIEKLKKRSALCNLKGHLRGYQLLSPSLSCRLWMGKKETTMSSI